MALSGVSIFGGIPMIYVGIDVAKSTHYAAVMNSEGVVLAEPFAFDNDAPGFSLLLKRFPVIRKRSFSLDLNRPGSIQKT